MGKDALEPASISKKTPHNFLLIFLSFLGGCILSTIICLMVLWRCENLDESPLYKNDTDANLLLSSKLHIVPQSGWLAQPSLNSLTLLVTPVPYVIISHTATEICLTQAECTLQVRILQSFHIESRHWDDIGYNFLVGGDGSAYEGRGWDAVGAHTYGYNAHSIGISFIGSFNTELPPKQQILAGQRLIEEGVNLGKIAKDYKLLAHRQVSGTESPGLQFFEEIKIWPHWAQSP